MYYTITFTHGEKIKHLTVTAADIKSLVISACNLLPKECEIIKIEKLGG